MASFHVFLKLFVCPKLSPTICVFFKKKKIGIKVLKTTQSKFCSGKLFKILFMYFRRFKISGAFPLFFSSYDFFFPNYKYFFPSIKLPKLYHNHLLISWEYLPVFLENCCLNFPYLQRNCSNTFFKKKKKKFINF